MAEPKSPLTSARMFDKQDNEHLAQWLDNDADVMDGQPGRNNHVAAVRAAAERLRSDALAQVKAERDNAYAWAEKMQAEKFSAENERDEVRAMAQKALEHLPESPLTAAAILSRVPARPAENGEQHD